MRTYADIKNHNDLHYAVRNGIMTINEALDIEKERELLSYRVILKTAESRLMWYN